MKLTMPSLGFKMIVIGYMTLQWLTMVSGIHLIASTVFFAIMLAFALGSIDAFKTSRKDEQ